MFLCQVVRKHLLFLLALKQHIFFFRPIVHGKTSKHIRRQEEKEEKKERPMCFLHFMRNKCEDSLVVFFVALLTRSSSFCFVLPSSILVQFIFRRKSLVIEIALRLLMSFIFGRCFVISNGFFVTCLV